MINPRVNKLIDISQLRLQIQKRVLRQLLLCAMCVDLCVDLSVCVSLVRNRVIALLRRIKQTVRTYNVLVLIAYRISLCRCLMMYKVHIIIPPLTLVTWLYELSILWWRLVLCVSLRWYLLLIVVVLVIVIIVSFVFIFIEIYLVRVKTFLTVLLLVLTVYGFVTIDSVLRPKVISTPDLMLVVMTMFITQSIIIVLNVGRRSIWRLRISSSIISH
jgi:hypothetical protein